MKIPRDLPGERLAEVLCRRWRYMRVHQTGSHIILETAEPWHQRVAVPAQTALRIGTLNSILRAVSGHKGVSKEAIIETL